MAIPMILGVICLIFACVKPRGVDSSDYSWSRVWLVLTGLFMIIITIVVASVAHSEAARAHAEANAESAAEAQAEQAFLNADAALQAEGIKIVTAIVIQTPEGKSPRTFPLSHLKDWLPEIANGTYTITPDSHYRKTGHLTLCDNHGAAATETYSLTVPSHVVSAAKIKSDFSAYVVPSMFGCP